MTSGVMTINYGSNSVLRAANTAAQAFEKARNNIQDVRKTINNMGDHSSHGYLSSASAFLRKKTQQYERREAALSNFKSRADVFLNSAESADKRVAEHLRDSFEHFKSVTGIQSGFWASIGKFLKGLATRLLVAFCPAIAIIAEWKAIPKVVEVIKAFYEKHKYLIDFLWDFTMCVVSVCAAIVAVEALVALLGVPALWLTAVGAIIAAITSITNMCRSGNALGCHKEGRDDLADYLRNMSAADYMGMYANDWFGWDADVVSNICTGIQIVGFACSLAGGLMSGMSYDRETERLKGKAGLIEKYKTDGATKTVIENLLKTSKWKEAKLDVAFFKKGMKEGFKYASSHCEVGNVVAFGSQVLSTLNLTKSTFVDGNIAKGICKALGIGDGYDIVTKAASLVN